MLIHRQRNRDLIAKAQAGDRSAMETLLEENAGLVGKYARFYEKYAHFCEIEDLKQLGRLGLVRAVETFDLSRGTAFSTHAGFQIRAEMKRAIDNGNLIRLPVWVNTKANTGRFGVDIPLCTHSLDWEPGEMYEGESLVDTLLVAPDDTEAEAIAAVCDGFDWLREAVRLCPMPAAHRETLILCYGLNGKRKHSIREVAKMLGISFQAVQSRNTASIRHLRHYIQERQLTPCD